MQDSKGYIWIANGLGAIRYDGKQFKTYDKRKGLTGSPYGSVEDKEGKIWFDAGAYSSIFYYHHDSVYSIKANEQLKQFTNKALIKKLSPDNESNLWFTLQTKSTFYKISSVDNYSNIEAMPLDSNDVHLKILDNGEYLSCLSAQSHKKNLIIHNPRGRKNDTIPLNIDLSHFARVVPFNDSVLFISDNNVIYTIRNKKIIKKQFTEHANMIKADDDFIWVTIRKRGIYKYHHNDLTVPLEHFLDGTTVFNVISDYEGGHWFSTYDHGVYYKRNLEDKTFHHPKLTSTVAFSRVRRAGRFLFIVTDEGKLLAIDSTLSVTDVNIGKLPLNPNIKDVIWHDSKYYLLGYSIFKCFNKDLKLVSSVKAIKDTTFSSGLNGNLRQIHFTGDDEFILNDGYTISLVKNMQVYKKFNFPTKITGFAYEEGVGNIYVGTFKGLYIISNQREPELILEQELRGNFIHRVLNLSASDILICSGLNIFLCKNKKCRKIFSLSPESDLLKFAVVDQTNIWLSTTTGLINLKKNVNGDFQPSYLSKPDGILSDKSLHLEWFNNLVWYSFDKGLYYFDPVKFTRPDAPPKVEIEELRINNEYFPRGENLSLNNDQNNISIRAACISFLPGKDPLLKYRLLGYDSAWYMTSENTINYTNLPPGKYRLEVNGISAKNILSSDTKTVSFIIQRPFWLTWWFITIAIITALGIICLAVFAIIRRIHKRELEKLNTSRLLSEYQMTALRAQINPHFIFNCIASIQNLVLKKNIDRAYEYLQKFSKLLRLVLQNSGKNFTGLDQELEVVNLYIELEQLRFDGSFKYTLNIDKEIKINQIIVPYMLLQPIVENAIWHGLLHSEKAEKLLTLNIGVGISGGISIEITDNGIGRKKSGEYNKGKTSQSMGENITKERLKLLSSSGNNAVIEVSDLYDKEKNVCGTSVKLLIPIIDEETIGHNY